ncbi:hypothetical protein MX850_07300 [Erysipelothrix sp. Poltava]|nr:hypothetical protein MX850_07300 [Erysipelothrix sp. Poltava]
MKNAKASEVVSGGASWIYAKTQDGVRGTKTTKYKETYNIKDELLSRVEIPEASCHRANNAHSLRRWTKGSSRCLLRSKPYYTIRS